MIVISVIILLTILIVSNIALGFYNELNPPCLDATEYFQNAKKLPDGISASLASIPSGTDMNYVGAKRVKGRNPGEIGLKSYVKEYEDSMTNRNETTEDEIIFEGDNATAKPAKITKDAYEALSAMFPVSSQKEDTTKQKVTEVDGYHAYFEDEMEGVGAPIHKKRSGSTAKPTNFAYVAERDGYEDS